MSSDPTDEYLERVKSEIRAEADAARLRAPLPRKALPESSTAEAARSDGIDRGRLDYAIGELTGLQYVAFVDNAFRALLKRPADEPGKDRQLRLLAVGAGKAEVLGNLRFSSEGRRVGVRVRGLLPRYALAKMVRIPVIGYVLEWLLALAAVPLLLRHQRGADTQNAARFHDVDAHLARRAEELQALAARFDEMKRELDETRAHFAVRAESLEQRATTLELRAQALSDSISDVPDLRHHILAVNHWSVSLQRSFTEIDEAAKADAERVQSLIAAMYGAPDAIADREARGARWLAALQARANAPARVLDLGSGDGDWIARLGTHGYDAAGVEPNPFLVARARERGLTVVIDEPFAWLARCADEDLDVITCSGGLPGNDDALADAFAQLRRALKPGGWVLIDCTRSQATGVLSASRGDVARTSRAVAASGFSLDASASLTDAVLAQRR
ncbi:MAG TPA: methyltransferase domain-containing protein [Rhodanobacteraceae bacterium]|nr:methyltransferase domain-containing protein [Rhodanobacteraceae bacterium]